MRGVPEVQLKSAKVDFLEQLKRIALDPNYLPYSPRLKYMRRRCFFPEIISLFTCRGCDVVPRARTTLNIPNL